MKLLYKAITKSGSIQQGIIEAKTIEEAAQFIRDKAGMIPISITKKQEELFTLPKFLNLSRGRDTVLFTRQLSSMLLSGFTLIQALQILKDQLQSEAMKELVSSIISEIQEGKSFSHALSLHPEYFSPIYVSLVAAGESSGLLDKILDRLSVNLEKGQKLRSTVSSALLYPAIIIILMVAVVVVMMLFVVPQLTLLYSNLNISLPLPTQIVIGVSTFTINYWPIALGTIVILGFAYNRWAATDSGKLVQDELLLRIPIIGNMLRLSLLAEFSRTLGLLVGSGTLVVQALTKTSDVTNNLVYKNAINDVSERVEKGVSIGDAMSVYEIFPPMLTQMVRIGEQTGKIDESLMKVSEYFDREVEGGVRGLTAALEPIIMVVLGLGVAFLIVSVITPIYNLTSSIQ